MKLEWDNKKIVQILKSMDSDLTFKGQTLTFLDDRHNYGEIRFITLGSLAGRIVALAHAQPREITHALYQ